MHRRAFLHPNQLARSVGQVAALLHGDDANECTPPAEIALCRFARAAMATQFEVILPFGTPGAMELAEQALDRIDRLEDQMTVFREHSEISWLNRLAADGPVTLEEGLYDLLARAAQITRETEGAFDIATGALTKAWGFYRRQGQVPSAEERAAVLERVGMRHVELDDQRRSVRYLRRGLEINLGSIGKGYALDRAGDLLRREGVSVGLIHGGQSSILALGRDPTDRRGWAVGVRHPWQPEQRLAVLRLRDQALGTSAATFQHLEYNGRKLGHILDPRSGWPAEGIANATAVAPTAAQADALATAFFILGVDKTQAYCQAHPEVGALLLPANDSAPVAINLSPECVDLMVTHTKYATAP
jgi:thiamine biosynthesis lipoprotein